MLNAFRHRGERDGFTRASMSAYSRCSTPSGIEANETRTARLRRGCPGTCSTPSGIEANETAGPALPRSPSAGAQRLPASRRTRLRGTVLGQSHPTCAQRLPASRRTRLSPVPVCVLFCKRAQRLSASRRTRPNNGTPRKKEIQCSTPSGIEANETWARRCGVPGASRGAQRLPASRRTRRVELPPAQPVAQVCSTPSGIEANETARAHRRALGWVRVLNAFRHRGERDPACAQYRCRSPSVLNAFRHRGERDTGRICGSPSPGSAQRLPASRRTRPLALTAGLLAGYACSTPSGIEANETPRVRSTGVAVLRCSTPSGIEANETWLRCMGRNGRQVLNAFRHRGERDDATVSGYYSGRASCSTPSGIEANETAWKYLRCFAVYGCSTPSGIEANETRAAKAAASHLSSTCSTPSGIEANETAGAPMWYATHHRCSTPSGIEANETWLRCMGRNGRQVLNAFRHRGERDDATVSGYYSGRASCSTPSGIEANETHRTPPVV